MNELYIPLTIEDAEFRARVTFGYEPNDCGADDMPASDEHFDISEVVIITTDENGHEVTTDITALVGYSETLRDAVIQGLEYENE